MKAIPLYSHPGATFIRFAWIFTRLLRIRAGIFK